LFLLLGGFGVDCVDHVVPFQLSASVDCMVPSQVPTALHEVAEVHETPSSTVDFAPEGLGVDWTDQVVPFQRSASDTCVPEL
jgi:hypothetical protein